MRRIKYVLVFLLMGMVGNLSAQITFFRGGFEKSEGREKGCFRRFLHGVVRTLQGDVAKSVYCSGSG